MHGASGHIIHVLTVFSSFGNWFNSFRSMATKGSSNSPSQHPTATIKQRLHGTSTWAPLKNTRKELVFERWQIAICQIFCKLLRTETQRYVPKMVVKNGDFHIPWDRIRSKDSHTNKHMPSKWWIFQESYVSRSQKWHVLPGTMWWNFNQPSMGKKGRLLQTHLNWGGIWTPKHT